MRIQRVDDMEAIWRATDGRWQPGLDSVKTLLTATHGWVTLRGRTPAEIIRRIQLVETTCPQLLARSEHGPPRELHVYRHPLED